MWILQGLEETLIVMKTNIIPFKNDLWIKASLDLSSNETRKMLNNAKLISKCITTVFPPNKCKIKGSKVAILLKILRRHLVSVQIETAASRPRVMVLQLHQMFNLEVKEVLSELDRNIKRRQMAQLRKDKMIS